MKLTAPKLTPEEKRALHDTWARKVLQRANVVANAAKRNNDKNATTLLAQHAVLSACKTLVEIRRDNTVVTEANPITGEKQHAKRRVACRHPLCLGCGGRAHRSRAHAAKVIDETNTHYQFALQVPPPFSRASLQETHKHTLKVVDSITSNPLWLTWAVGWSVSLELTPSSVSDGGRPHFHLHVIAQLPSDADNTMPVELRQFLRSVGTLGEQHAVVEDETTNYFHAYSVKGFAGKGKLSPLVGAKNDVIDAMLLLVASRATFHTFGGTWSSSTTSAPINKVKRTKRIKPTNKVEAVRQLASRIRLPDVVLVEKDEGTNVAQVEVVVVDVVGRRRQTLAHAVVPLVVEEV